VPFGFPLAAALLEPAKRIWTLIFFGHHAVA
jgi:hypothetical protein